MSSMFPATKVPNKSTAVTAGRRRTCSMTQAMVVAKPMASIGKTESNRRAPKEPPAHQSETALLM